MNTPHWTPPRFLEFWSIVPHADMVYGRTASGIMFLDQGEPYWRGVRNNPYEEYCLGLAAGPGSRSPIYALEHDLFVSHDGCRTWERRALPFLPLSYTTAAIAAGPSSEQPYTVYAFGRTLAQGDDQIQHVLYASHDAGRTWGAPLRPGPVGPAYRPARHQLLALPPIPGAGPGSVFMATSHGLYKAPDNPVRDQPEPLLEFPPSTQRAIDAMAVGARPPHPLAVGINQPSGHHIQVSPDGGKTWVTRDPPGMKLTFVDDLLFAGDLLFAKVTYLEGEGQGRVLGAILMSHDMGATWTDLATPDLAPLLPDMATPPFANENLAATSTHLFVMARRTGVRSTELAALNKPKG